MCTELPRKVTTEDVLTDMTSRKAHNTIPNGKYVCMGITGKRKIRNIKISVFMYLKCLKWLKETPNLWKGKIKD